MGLQQSVIGIAKKKKKKSKEESMPAERLKESQDHQE
jgi:hypothetical protein